METLEPMVIRQELVAAEVLEAQTTIILSRGMWAIMIRAMVFLQAEEDKEVQRDFWVTRVMRGIREIIQLLPLQTVYQSRRELITP